MRGNKLVQSTVAAGKERERTCRAYHCSALLVHVGGLLLVVHNCNDDDDVVVHSIMQLEPVGAAVASPCCGACSQPSAPSVCVVLSLVHHMNLKYCILPAV